MPPILAIEFSTIFALAFLLISFIGWIMNLINAQNPPPQPKGQAVKRPQPRDRKVQTEIEDFLREAIGRGGQKKPQGQSEGIEIIEPGRPARRRPPRDARPKGALETAQSAKQTTSQARIRPGEEMATRHVQSSQALGSGITSHVEGHMGLRVGQQSEQHLPHSVNRSIASHLGEFRADDHDPRSTVAPVVQSRAAVSDPTGLIADLRKPSSMRKAVILQEILSRPLALRKG